MPAVEHSAPPRNDILRITAELPFLTKKHKIPRIRIGRIAQNRKNKKDGRKKRCGHDVSVSPTAKTWGSESALKPIGRFADAEARRESRGRLIMDVS